LPCTVDEDDIFEILDELKDVKAQCYNIAIRLKLKPNIVEEIRKEKLDDAEALMKVINSWLIKKLYNTEKFGAPTWRAVVEAVEHSGGGNHRALAIEIAKRHHCQSC